MKQRLCLFSALVLVALSALGSDEPGQRTRATSGDGYPPPEADDVTFVSETGDLNVYHFTSDGPLDVDIAIDRYFGDKQERETQISRGFLPSSVELYIPAHDVDYAMDPGAEFDWVFFNGTFIGCLMGGDDTWYMNKFDIPIELVNFPEQPGDVAHNSIRILVDTSNATDKWCTMVSWASIIIPAARPLVLVNGWCGEPTCWTEIQDYIKKNYGIPTYTASFNSLSSCKTNSYFLDEQIQHDVLEAWNVDEVNVMAHSKGGLDSRRLTNRNGVDADYVNNVCQIATPNGGSFLADILVSVSANNTTAGIGLLCGTPALLNLTTTGAYYFNKLYPTSASNANIKVLAGNVPIFGSDFDSYLGYLDEVFSSDSLSLLPDINLRGDGIVSVDSAHTAVTPMGSSPINHDKATHTKICHDLAPACIAVYRPIITERKQAKFCGLETTAPQSLTRSNRGSGSGETFIKVGTNHANESSQTDSLQFSSAPATSPEGVFHILEPGESYSTTCVIYREQPLHLFFLGLDEDSDISIITPDGTVYSTYSTPEFFSASDQDQPEIKDALGLADTTLLFELEQNAPAGDYQVTVNNGKNEAPVSLAMLYDNQWPELTLHLAIEDSCYLRKGQKYVLQAYFQDGQKTPSSASMHLSCGQWDDFAEGDTSRTQQLELNDAGLAPDTCAGDGIFSGYFKPKYEGANILYLEGKLLPDAEHQISRKLLSIVPVHTSTSTIASVTKEIYRKTANEATEQGYESLEFELELNISLAGTYSVSGSLFDSKDAMLATSASQRLYLPAGKQTILLRFEGKSLYLPQDGEESLYLKDLKLFEFSSDSGEPVPVSDAGFYYETAPVNRRDFLKPNFTCLGNAEDYAVDINGDGYPDNLYVKVDVRWNGDNVTYCTILGNLIDDYGYSIPSNIVTCYFTSTSPEKKITLCFNCEKLRKAQLQKASLQLTEICITNDSDNISYLPCSYRTREYLFSPLPQTLVPSETKSEEICNNLQTTFTAGSTGDTTGKLRCSLSLTEVSASTALSHCNRYWLVLPENLQPAGNQSLDAPCQETAIEITNEFLQALTRVGNGDTTLDPDETPSFTVAIAKKSGDSTLNTYGCKIIGAFVPSETTPGQNETEDDPDIAAEEFLALLELCRQLGLDESDFLQVVAN